MDGSFAISITRLLQLRWARRWFSPRDPEPDKGDHMHDARRQAELGQQDGIFETRIEWEGEGRRFPVVYTRKVCLAIKAEIAGPEAFLDLAWTDITASARAAGAITGLSTIVTSPPGTLEVFEEAFFACLASHWPQEARRIQVGLSTQLLPEEDWRRSLTRAG